MKILEWIVTIILWVLAAMFFVLCGWMLRATKQRVVDQANYERDMA